MESKEREALLARLREPFHEKEISYKPKPTKAQTEEVKRDFSKGIRCKICGGWHHPKAVHLAYVGHAATTKRLLEVDPAWSWDFLNTDDSGMPIFDKNGGLWITLTILGIARKGYGDAEGKQGANAVKEIIGDAIRNAAMRFGVALELWHKGEFHREEGPEELPTYPDESFNNNLPRWADDISRGKKTPEEIISFLGSRGVRLSEDQKREIEAVPSKYGNDRE